MSSSVVEGDGDARPGLKALPTPVSSPSLPDERHLLGLVHSDPVGVKIGTLSDRLVVIGVSGSGIEAAVDVKKFVVGFGVVEASGRTLLVSMMST